MRADFFVRHRRSTIDELLNGIRVHHHRGIGFGTIPEFHAPFLRTAFTLSGIRNARDQNVRFHGLNIRYLQDKPQLGDPAENRPTFRNAPEDSREFSASVYEVFGR
jgi:hypothetical protein